MEYTQEGLTAQAVDAEKMGSLNWARQLRAHAAALETIRELRLFLADTGYVLRHPMYADSDNRDGLAEDCKRFATGEVCAQYLDVKHQTERAILAEETIRDRDAEIARLRDCNRTFRGLIADDAYAASFQTLGQYRTNILGWIDESAYRRDEEARDG